MDLSSAHFVLCQMPGPIPIRQTVRSGAEFIFRGGLDRDLIVSPQLEAIGEHTEGDWLFLILCFSSPPVQVYEKLSGIGITGPAFVICRMEEQKEDERLIGQGRVWEQGYYIAGVVEMTMNKVMLAVRKGVKER